MIGSAVDLPPDSVTSRGKDSKSAHARQQEPVKVRKLATKRCSTVQRDPAQQQAGFATKRNSSSHHAHRGARVGRSVDQNVFVLSVTNVAWTAALPSWPKRVRAA